MWDIKPYRSFKVFFQTMNLNLPWADCHVCFDCQCCSCELASADVEWIAFLASPISILSAIPTKVNFIFNTTIYITAI